MIGDHIHTEGQLEISMINRVGTSSEENDRAFSDLCKGIEDYIHSFGKGEFYTHGVGYTLCYEQESCC